MVSHHDHLPSSRPVPPAGARGRRRVPAWSQRRRVADHGAPRSWASLRRSNRRGRDEGFRLAGAVAALAIIKSATPRAATRSTSARCGSVRRRRWRGVRVHAGLERNRALAASARRGDGGDERNGIRCDGAWRLARRLTGPAGVCLPGPCTASSDSRTAPSRSPRRFRLARQRPSPDRPGLDRSEQARGGDT